MTTKYFKNIRDVETLKEQYRAVAKKYHSDINHGGDEAMKQINAEYARLKSIYANIHRTEKSEQPKTEHATSKQAEPKQAEPQNAPDSLKFIAIRLSALDGIKLEICGKWLWISGNTAKHRDTLKDNGCKWAPKKKNVVLA